MPNFYESHPKSCAPDDYWGQVGRTLDGKPLPKEQIELIVSSMAQALELDPDDRLLDLCCGNGALSTRWFADCAGGLGVDMSTPLMEVALRDFARPDREEYLLASVLDFAQDPARFGAHGSFDKGICFGSLQYLERDHVRLWLADLRRSFPGLRRLVLGNVPDRAQVKAFARDGVVMPLDDPESALGCWWDRDELAIIADRAGFVCRTQTPPAAFYASHYRFDAILDSMEI